MVTSRFALGTELLLMLEPVSVLCRPHSPETGMHLVIITRASSARIVYTTTVNTATLDYSNSFEASSGHASLHMS